jgi:Glycosyl hydrolases family 2/Glycosyl hydrolases family 2, sugar binding domain/Glycosyl hydrolases family 2, TIM barrel domain
MKRYFFILLIIAGCTSNEKLSREKLSLAGEWQFRIDSLDMGIENKWYQDTFNESVRLPGSMAENGKGYEVTVNTDWTGNIVDRSYFTDKKYEKYRQPGNIKIPFWLKPVKYYKGVAWYQKEIDIPEKWAGKRVILFLERCHWESTVFVNGNKAGSKNFLATPHEYDISNMLIPGTKNKISIRIDNRVIIPIGVNSHSISDHTQSNWNGITGEINLIATSEVYINEVNIYPDIKNKKAKVIVSIKNPGNIDFKGKIRIKAKSFNSENNRTLRGKNVTFVTNADERQSIVDYKIPKPQLWSEFDPAMYRLTVSLKKPGNRVIDKLTFDFGMREFRANGTRFEVNGIPIFLRGTTECCIFPLTGYPPTDVESWVKVLKTVKSYGLNHVRFHSFCPPEAAFEAADRLGIYLHIECSSWANQGASVGDGTPEDKFIYQESNMILREYGNHPSFCMMAYGNEPAGKNQNKYLGDLISYWKSIDNRRVYTSAAGWPVIPENDYNLMPAPRIQQWGQGLKSIINSEPPQTMFDYRDIVSKYNIPTISHEIGQWCVYPDFKEIKKYTGVLKATNFEIFRETLEENNMGDQAEDFLKASGKLQVICYKAEIEAALRTPGFAGFEILQLHDFPGQGTALVGILNPFFQSKGYVTPQEFRMFCNETVPLARMWKLIYKNGETFEPRIEIAHFGANPLYNAEIICQVADPDGNILRKEIMTMDKINIGNDNIAGVFAMDIKGIEKAQKLTFEVSISGTPFINRWNFWVYPSDGVVESGKVCITDKLDRSAENILKKGGSVLFLTYGNVGKTKGAQVAIGFSSIFWNTAWTNNQPPHTLGILCNPEHPLFRDFPTEYHSDWQWWDPLSHSQVMILDGFPAELKPLIQPIDTWFENRLLALAFEAKTAGGKLMVCSINMKDSLDRRPVTKQLLRSMLNYMNSEAFAPKADVDIQRIKELINK